MTKYKYILSAAFILSFLSFLTADIFYYSLAGIFGNLYLALGLVLLLLIFSIILFSILIIKYIYSAEPLTVKHKPLISSFRSVNDPLLMIRFFAFFCIIVTHCLICFKLDEKLDLDNMPWQFLLYGCAHSGMIIFFCLSGYLMGKAFFSKRYLPNSSSIKSFYANRALRIVPLCYFATFICTVFLRPDILKDPTMLWRPLLFLYYGGEQSPIGALWALSVEMQYYIIAPFIFILFGHFLNTKTRSYIFIFIVITLGLGLKYKLAVMHYSWYEFRYSPLYANLDSFLVGFGINGLIEQGRKNIRESKNYKINAAVAFVLCVFIYLIGSGGEYSPQLKTLFVTIIDINNIIYIFSQGDSFSQFYNHIVFTVILVMTLFCIYNVELYKVKRKFITEDKIGLFQLLNKKISKVLQILGLLSFGLYVWHSPILDYYIKFFPHYTLSNYFFICCIGLLPVFILSIITYYLIERPCEKYKI